MWFTFVRSGISLLANLACSNSQGTLNLSCLNCLTAFFGGHPSGQHTKHVGATNGLHLPSNSSSASLEHSWAWKFEEYLNRHSLTKCEKLGIWLASCADFSSRLTVLMILKVSTPVANNGSTNWFYCVLRLWIPGCTSHIFYILFFFSFFFLLNAKSFFINFGLRWFSIAFQGLNSSGIFMVHTPQMTFLSNTYDSIGNSISFAFWRGLDVLHLRVVGSA